MPGNPVTSTTKPEVVRIYDGRITEDFLVQQYEYHVGRESYRDRTARIEDGDLLYAGQLRTLFPDETAVPQTPLVENKYKNVLHDLSRLAASSQGAPFCIPRGDSDRDLKAARLRESVLDTYWQMNRARRLERQFYMDLVGAGGMATSVYYQKGQEYPKIARLNPRYCYPDLRAGDLSSMVFAETLKEREAAFHYPDFNLRPDAGSAAEVTLVCYYGPDETVECIIRKDKSGRAKTAYITQRWVHNFGMPTASFVPLTSYDGAIRGLLDQMSGPMLARNKIVRFLVDYLEQMSHSPLFVEGVENPDEDPGPMTVYRGDPNAERSHVQRVSPATPAGSVFGLLSYMDDQEQKEAVQPPARVGQVRQSIASGSFVASTQGQLTSVVEEMQEAMGELRRQTGVLAARVDETYLNTSKPLVRSVGKVRTYLPAQVFNGWYEHEIRYGAGAGLDKINADNRILQHLSARLISRSTARSQIDYLTDASSEQEDIDAENVADALLQRFATDPATPMPVLAQVMVAMSEGRSLVEAMGEAAPQLVTQPEEAPAPEPGTEMLPAGETAGPAIPAPGLQAPPIQQVFVR